MYRREAELILRYERTGASCALQGTGLFYNPYMQSVFTQRAAAVRLVVFDVDGVLTDGRLYFTDGQRAGLAFSVRDGHGIRLLLHYGMQVAVLSGRESDTVSQRMAALGVRRVYQGVRDKKNGFARLLEDCSVAAENTAYMGDDLQDLAPMQRAGLACTVADAHPEIIRHADWVAKLGGGRGGARELCDALLKAQGQWDRVIRYCSA